MNENYEVSAVSQLERDGSGAAAALAELSESYRRESERKSGQLIKSYRWMIITLLIVVALLAAAVAIVAVGWMKEQGTVVTQVEQVEVIKEVEVERYIAIDPSEEYSHELSDDSFLLYDSSYGPIWMPALEAVPRCSYDRSLFEKDSDTGYMTYNDDSIKTRRGIDVSIYQGDIDWHRVKESGVDFAIIRLGFRGYVTGTVNEDANFRRNLEGAKEAGIDVGVYFFSQATDAEEALEEAEFCLELLDGTELEYPIFYDWEVVIDKDGDTPRTSDIQPEVLTNNLLVFCERVRLAGYTPGVYANKKTAIWKYDLSRLGDVEFWLAEYSDCPEYYYDFAIWQYSSKGSVPGIEGNVDLNIGFGEPSGSKDE